MNGVLINKMVGTSFCPHETRWHFVFIHVRMNGMDAKRLPSKLDDLVGKIVKESQPEKIILFGSWAWGNPGPDSDVDLLVIKHSLKSRLQRERELGAMLFPRKIPLDLLVYTPDELEESINKNRNLFIEDIIRNGRVLYAKAGSDFSVALPARPLTVLR